MSVISRAVLAAIFATLVGAAAILTSAGPADAADRPVTVQDTARLLGYMWGDGTETNGVWSINGPSGASSLIEELVELHGGTWVDRGRLTFRLSAPYDWSDWKDSLPDDSAHVRNAVRDTNFLAALLEVEGSTGGLVYDQSACCTPGFTQGRLIQLRDMLVETGYRTASYTRFNNVDSGRIDIDPSEFSRIRNRSDFVCPLSDDAIRIPGGTEYATYGNLDWIDAGSVWGDVVRTECRNGQTVPAPTPISATCTASANGNEVTLDWSFTLGDAVVRRNNTFIENAAGRDGSWSETQVDGTYNYQIRHFAFGVRTDISCGSVTVGAGGGGGVPAPVGPCTISDAGNGQVLLSWDDFDQNSYFVRKNDRWVQTVRGSFTATAAGSTADDWAIRYFGGGRTDVPCTVANNGGGGPACTVTNQNGGVRVDWNDVDGVSRYQVRLNNRWRATVTNATVFDDPTGSTAGNYVVRYWTNGSNTDISCG